MTEIIEKLYRHATEKNYHPYMSTQEYSHYAHKLEELEATIQQLLPQEQSKLVDELHQAIIYCSSIEQEAAFQSGLAIGLELSRL